MSDVAGPKRTARWIMGGFLVILIMLTLFLFWVKHYSAEKEARLSAMNFHGKSQQSQAALKRCFDGGKRGGRTSLALGHRWRMEGDSIENENEARHLKLVVTDLGNSRSVDIYSRMGKGLRKSNYADIHACLSIGLSTRELSNR